MPAYREQWFAGTDARAAKKIPTKPRQQWEPKLDVSPTDFVAVKKWAEYGQQRQRASGAEIWAAAYGQNMGSSQWSRKQWPEEATPCISNASTTDSADGSDAEGDAIDHVIAILSEKLWQGIEGETYKISPRQGKHGWNVTRTGKGRAQDFTIRYDDHSSAIWWGSWTYFFDPLELGPTPSEIKWYGAKDPEKTKPKFVWKALPLPAHARAEKPLPVSAPVVPDTSLLVPAPVVTEKPLLVPALAATEKSLTGYRTTSAPLRWCVKVSPKLAEPEIELKPDKPDLQPSVLDFDFEPPPGLFQAVCVQAHPAESHSDQKLRALPPGLVEAPSVRPPPGLAPPPGLDIMGAASMMAADMAAERPPLWDTPAALGMSSRKECDTEQAAIVATLLGHPGPIARANETKEHKQVRSKMSAWCRSVGLNRKH